MFRIIHVNEWTRSKPQFSLAAIFTIIFIMFLCSGENFSETKFLINLHRFLYHRSSRCYYYRLFLVHSSILLRLGHLFGYHLLWFTPRSFSSWAVCCFRLYCCIIHDIKMLCAIYVHSWIYIAMAFMGINNFRLEAIVRNWDGDERQESAQKMLTTTTQILEK